MQNTRLFTQILLYISLQTVLMKDFPNRLTKKNTAITTRTIMSVILLMKGPVCTHRAVHKNGPVAVRHIVKHQFLRAADALQAANLGVLETIKPPRRPSHEVFVKKEPGLIGSDLARNADLCTLGEYMARFYMATPGCIDQELRNELTKRQLVRPEYFNSSSWRQHAFEAVRGQTMICQWLEVEHSIFWEHFHAKCMFHLQWWMNYMRWPVSWLFSPKSYCD